MKQSFTQTSLIRFIYNEVSASERIAIMEAARTNRQLRKELQTLKAAQVQLPRAKFNAPKRALDKILCYSKTNAMEEC